MGMVDAGKIQMELPHHRLMGSAAVKNLTWVDFVSISHVPKVRTRTALKRSAEEIRKGNV